MTLDKRMQGERTQQHVPGLLLIHCLRDELFDEPPNVAQQLSSQCDQKNGPAQKECRRGVEVKKKAIEVMAKARMQDLWNLVAVRHALQNGPPKPRLDPCGRSLAIQRQSLERQDRCEHAPQRCCWSVLLTAMKLMVSHIFG